MRRQRTTYNCPWAPSGVLHNMSAPPRTQVKVEVRPVFGAVIFCVSQCLRLNNFFDPDWLIGETDFKALGRETAEWARNPGLRQFWGDVKQIGVTPETADACARELGGACIGWSKRIYPQATGRDQYPAHNRICTDLNLCLAILSRRAGNLFLSYRPPDYSRDQLFHWAFVADDPRLLSRSIPWEDWPVAQAGTNANGGGPDPEKSPLKHGTGSDIDELKARTL